MRQQLIPMRQIVSSDDWRPVYHLSPAAVLPRIGDDWHSVADSAVELHDGWRFSDRVESDWYLRHVALRDPAHRDSATGEYLQIPATPEERERAGQYKKTIECERFYRMRHVGDMELHVNAVLMEQPTINQLNACVVPGDVVVRRVGHVGAALVTRFHRRHPVDANIAILRGLDSHQAVWVTYCLNQSIYRSYFEQAGAIGPMVRVGLKQLASMPLAECPKAFDVLADQFWFHYERQVQADDHLQRLRGEVADWIAGRLQERVLFSNGSGLVARFFHAEDIGQTLNYSATEQNQIRRELIQEHECVPLSHLAEVNPKGGSTPEESDRILKIGDLTGQLDILLDSAQSSDSRWRYHRRPLRPLSVLVSTFVQEPKVALFTDVQSVKTFASEQLAVLNFHHTPGAYALLLETDLVRQQIVRLATGTVQRFVQPEFFKQIVVPVIETEIAKDWHQRMIDIQRNKAEARRALVRLKDEMYSVYRQVHPELEGIDQDSNIQEASV